MNKISRKHIREVNLHGHTLKREDRPDIVVELIRCYNNEWDAFIIVNGVHAFPPPHVFSWVPGNAPLKEVNREVREYLKGLID